MYIVYYFNIYYSILFRACNFSSDIMVAVKYLLSIKFSTLSLGKIIEIKKENRLTLNYLHFFFIDTYHKMFEHRLMETQRAAFGRRN